VPTPKARIKILTLTPTGISYLEQRGIALPPGRRGGAAHEYWRAIIRSVLERDGYSVQEEVGIGDAQRVDLHACKGERAVTLEVETGKSDVGANIKKCERLSGTVVFFFVTTELRNQWELPSGFIAVTPHDLDTLPKLLRGFS